MLRFLLILVITASAWSCTQEEKMMVGWGDSMMKGSGSEISILEVIEQELGVCHKNFGEGGLWSSQVALLQGAHSLIVESEESVIAPMGTIKLKIIGAQPFNSFGPQEYEGNLKGVLGELIRVHQEGNRELTDHFEFKRGLSFFEKKLEKPFAFSFANAETYNQSMTLIWAGRNDDKSGDNLRGIVDNLEAMVNHIAPEARKKTLVLSICNGKSTLEGKGTIAYKRIVALNKMIENRLPEYYVDVRAYMVQNAIYNMGIVPSVADLAAINKDAIPDIFFHDHVHFNELGNRALGNYLSQVILEREWIK